MPLMARHIRQRAAQHIGSLCSTGPALVTLNPFITFKAQQGDA
ncbi:Uncharacterised protein [Klebsiella pneumoniae]|nr:Uncharacterised protein [Klebsiella pneumoniae]